MRVIVLRLQQVPLCRLFRITQAACDACGRDGTACTRLKTGTLLVFSIQLLADCPGLANFRVPKSQAFFV
jgi:hypothetical protein